MNRSYYFLSIICAAGLSIWAVGCGSSLECGPDTKKSGEQCVPAASTCGEGTKQVDGACVLESEPVTCASGTTKESGECVPEVECGPDTEADASGQCVPSYEMVACGDGTTKQNNECVANQVACGKGTKLKDGECVENAFSITKLEHPGEIVAGSSGMTIKIHWQGEPKWPLTIHSFLADKCPSDTSCGAGAEVEVTSMSNPIVKMDGYGCDNPLIGETFTYALMVEDANGTETNTEVLSWECVSN